MDCYDARTNRATFAGETCSASLTVKAIAEVVGLEAHDGEGVFRYLNAGHSEALQIFDRFCHNLAAQIINLQYVVDPEIFAIGGGISVQPLFIDRLRKAIADILTGNPHHVAQPKLTTCHFSSQANIYGALYIVSTLTRISVINERLSFNRDERFFIFSFKWERHGEVITPCAFAEAIKWEW